MAEVRADIVVIGLGPAGCRAAAVAASAGGRVVALDRRRVPGSPVQCAEFVPALLGPDVDGLGPVTAQRISAMATFVEDQAPDVRQDFPGHMIDRRRFDEALANEARAAGAECRFAAPVVSIAADGAVRLASGGTLRARVLIGADGPRSLVGRAVGLVNRDLVETRQALVRLKAPFSATDIFLSADMVGGYGWLFPKGDVANLGVGVAPSARHRLKPLLKALHGALARAGRVGTEVLGLTGGPIPVGGLVGPAARLGTTRVFLAGDAAGLSNPVTGAGIASAVYSGALAGEAAAAYLGGDDGAPADYTDEIEALFKPALERALKRRRDLLASHAGGGPGPAELRRGWIAYAEYWAA